MTSQPDHPSREDSAPSAPIIRGASLEGDDARFVSELVSAYLTQTEREKLERGVGESSSTAHVLPSQYEREVRDPHGAYADCTVLIAEVEQRPVGVVVVRVAGGEAEIKRLWADPSVRGRGVGSALLNAALELAPGPIRLSVWEWRSAALRLYESRGFVRVASWDVREGLVCMARPGRGSAAAEEMTIRMTKGTLGESTLRTDRLTLRPQEIGDADVFHRLWGERDERVPEHRKLDADGRPTLSDIATHIAGAKDARSDLLTVVDRSTGDVYGYCGLIFEGNGSAEEPEIAFGLLREVQGRGYATEAGRAVLAWASSAGFARTWASVWEWNVASRRVLEKLGFVDSGCDRAPSEHGRNILTVAILSETREVGQG